MGKRAQLWFALAILSVGCSRQDPEHLARVGARIGHRAQNAVSGSNDRLLHGWQSIRSELALDARVMARLSTDKLLFRQPIHVQVSGGEVQLHGTVENTDQRRRALQLAEWTVGVEKVVDRLEGP